MATGTIKTIRPEKGFGFIKRRDSGLGAGDLFFHSSTVEGVLFDDLREGQEVSFEEGQDPRDPSRQRAVNVRLVTTGDSDE
jgi:CspA family cold shock protein